MSWTMEDALNTTNHEPEPYVDGEAGPVIPSAAERPRRDPVVVRRHAWLSAVIGLGGSMLSGLYFVRAVEQGGSFTWVVAVALAAIALVHLTQWVDARTPLLVADATGVRLRLGNAWHGLVWEDVSKVTVRERAGLFRDGRVVVHPVDESALEGLGGRSGRRLAANTKMYGAPFAIPLGLTTVSSTDDLAGALEHLATAETTVELTDPAGEPVPAHEESADESVEADLSSKGDESPEVAEARTESYAATEGERQGAESSDSAYEWADSQDRADDTADADLVQGDADEATVDSTSDPGSSPEPEPRPEPQPKPEPTPSTEPGPRHDPTPVPSHEPDPPTRHGWHGLRRRREAAEVEVPEPPEPLRPVRRALRSDVVRPPTVRAPIVGQLALQDPVHDDNDESSGASSEARDGEDARTDRPRGPRPRGNMSLVLGETPPPLPAEPEETKEPEPVVPTEPEPAAVPVIGPAIVEARRVLGLSVDDLAARTRIRPHVIEAIEVDDFGPCAGDFYARGHLRALARVLGIDDAPLLERFEELYATAPINARRVFEAELAAGDAGAIRGVGSHGRPRWGGLIAGVLVLLLVWALVSVFFEGASGEAFGGSERVGGAPSLHSAPLPPTPASERAYARLHLSVRYLGA
jgi:cytoskeleton protein RodZ